jgi:hypothetical protein
MHNKIKSFNIRGKRQPGRPFNTTTYPWRSTAIGRSFYLDNCHPPAGRMIEKLRNEGFDYRYRITDYGTVVTRIA